MTRQVLLSLCLMFLCGPAVHADPVAAFKRANEQFAAEEFEAAAVNYEKSLTEGGGSAAAYYNLGNAYQRLGRFGPAILAYERARLLSPRDPDLLVNLARARKAAAAFETPGIHPRLDLVLQYFSRNEWSWLVAGCALFLGAVAVLGGMVCLPRGWMRGARVSASVAGVVILLGAIALYQRRAEATRGVVLSEGATVRLSPFEKAEALGTTGPGRIVKLGKSEGGFRYVEVPGANLRGWLAVRDVAAISKDESGGR